MLGSAFFGGGCVLDVVSAFELLDTEVGLELDDAVLLVSELVFEDGAAGLA